MKKQVRGFCPVQEKECSVFVEYFASETLEGMDYAKGGIDCDYNQANHTCTRNDCPIWNSAPNKP